MRHSVLLIGLGNIGMGYDFSSSSDDYVATLAKSFSLHPRFDLIGAVDSDFEKRESFLCRYKCPAYSNIKAAIKDNVPDIVVIAVPTELHFDIFMEVVESTLPKAILCEKPLSNNYEEASKMVKLSEKYNLLLFTNYMRRCDQAVINVRHQIDVEEIKTPVKGVCWYSKGFIHNGSHFLNLFQYWLGEVMNFDVISQGEKTSLYDVEPDVKITFEKGEVYFLLANEKNFSHNTYELIAGNGRLWNERGVLSWQSIVPDENYSDYTILNDSSEAIKSEPHRLQWHVADQLYLCLKGKKSPICTGEEGLSTLYECMKIKNSIQRIKTF